MSSKKGQSFASQVSAVSPLKGDAIDGSARPKPRRDRKPAREPMDRSLTFFCSNPQCGHGTWSPVEQARHMAREFWETAQALVRLAPESPEALAVTGGVILRDLDDDECREAAQEYERALQEGTQVSAPIVLRAQEHWRRGGRFVPKAPSRRTNRGRDAEAMEYRLKGWTYDRIALEMGYQHRSAARKAVRRALGRQGDLQAVS